MTTQPDPFQRSLRTETLAVNATGKQVTLKWNSLPGASYRIDASDDFTGWDPEPGGEAVVSQGSSTTHILSCESLPVRRFYRITEIP